NQPAGFIEFSGKTINLQAQPFTLNSQDTLLLDPDYIIIREGAQPPTCPPVANQCGFDSPVSNQTITATTDTDPFNDGLGTTYIYEDTLEAVTTGTISLSAVKGIFTSSPSTNFEITLASGVNISLTTTCTSSSCTDSLSDFIQLNSGGFTTQGNGTITINSGSRLEINNDITSESGDISITAATNITTSGTPTITTTSGDISITATGGSIGASGNPVEVSRTSGWSSSNLILSSFESGNIYLRSANTGLTDATINTFSSGTLSLEQTSGSFAISSALTFSNATLELISSNDIALAASITATSVTLNAGTSITRSAGAITSGTSGTISLTATTGDIGTSSNPISITQNATTGDLTATASSGDIYISGTASLLLGNISTLGSTSSAIDITAATNLARTSATNITSGTSGTISLTATTGSIGTSANRINITQQSTTGDLTATALSGNIYLNGSASLQLGNISTLGSTSRAIDITATNLSRTSATNITSGISGTISLTATAGSIGTSISPINIVQNATTGDFSSTGSNVFVSSTSSNLQVGAVTGTTEVSLIATALIAAASHTGISASTYSLTATSGNIGTTTNRIAILTNPTAFTASAPAATAVAHYKAGGSAARTTILNGSTVRSGANSVSGVIGAAGSPNILSASIASIEVSTGTRTCTANCTFTINAAGEISNTEGYTINAKTISISSTANIGTMLHPIIVSTCETAANAANITCTDNSTFTSISITAANGGDIYIKRANDEVLGIFSAGTVSFVGTGVGPGLSIYLIQDNAVATITQSISASLSAARASITNFYLSAPSIVYNADLIFTTKITLKATDGSITTNGTAFLSAPSIELITTRSASSTNADIGSASSPIRISSASAFTDPQTAFTGFVANTNGSGSIYLSRNTLAADLIGSVFPPPNPNPIVPPANPNPIEADGFLSLYQNSSVFTYNKPGSAIEERLIIIAPGGINLTSTGNIGRAAFPIRLSVGTSYATSLCNFTGGSCPLITLSSAGSVFIETNGNATNLLTHTIQTSVSGSMLSIYQTTGDMQILGTVTLGNFSNFNSYVLASRTGGIVVSGLASQINLTSLVTQLTLAGKTGIGTSALGLPINTGATTNINFGLSGIEQDSNINVEYLGTNTFNIGTIVKTAVISRYAFIVKGSALVSFNLAASVPSTLDFIDWYLDLTNGSTSRVDTVSSLGGNSITFSFFGSNYITRIGPNTFTTKLGSGKLLQLIDNNSIISGSSIFDLTAFSPTSPIKVCDAGSVCRLGTATVAESNSIRLAYNFPNAGGNLNYSNISLDINSSGSPGDTLIIDALNSHIIPSSSSTTISAGKIYLNARLIGTEAFPVLFASTSILPSAGQIANAYFKSQGAIYIGANSLSGLFCARCVDIYFNTANYNTAILSITQVSGAISNTGGFSVGFENKDYSFDAIATTINCGACNSGNQFMFTSTNIGALVIIEAKNGSITQSSTATDAFTYNSRLRLKSSGNIGTSTSSVNISPNIVAGSVPPISLEAGTSSCTASCGEIYITNTNSFALDYARVISSTAKVSANLIKLVSTSANGIVLYGNSSSTVLIPVNNGLSYESDGLYHVAEWTITAPKVYATSISSGYISASKITLNSGLIGLVNAPSTSPSGDFTVSADFPLTSALKISIIPTTITNALPETSYCASCLVINSGAGTVTNGYVNIFFDASRENYRVECGSGTVLCPREVVFFDRVTANRTFVNYSLINALTSKKLDVSSFSPTTDNFIKLVSASGTFYIPNVITLSGGATTTGISITAFGNGNNEGVFCLTAATCSITAHRVFVRSNSDIGTQTDPLTVNATRTSFIARGGVYLQGNDLFALYSLHSGVIPASVQFISGAIDSSNFTYSLDNDVLGIGALHTLYLKATPSTGLVTFTTTKTLQIDQDPNIGTGSNVALTIEVVGDIVQNTGTGATKSIFSAVSNVKSLAIRTSGSTGTGHIGKPTGSGAGENPIYFSIDSGGSLVIETRSNGNAYVNSLTSSVFKRIKATILEYSARDAANFLLQIRADATYDSTNNLNAIEADEITLNANTIGTADRPVTLIATSVGGTIKLGINPNSSAPGNSIYIDSKNSLSITTIYARLVVNVLPISTSLDFLQDSAATSLGIFTTDLILNRNNSKWRSVGTSANPLKLSEIISDTSVSVELFAQPVCNPPINTCASYLGGDVFLIFASDATIKTITSLTLSLRSSNSTDTISILSIVNLESSAAVRSRYLKLDGLNDFNLGSSALPFTLDVPGSDFLIPASYSNPVCTVTIGLCIQPEKIKDIFSTISTNLQLSNVSNYTIRQFNVTVSPIGLSRDSPDPAFNFNGKYLVVTSNFYAAINSTKPISSDGSVSIVANVIGLFSLSTIGSSANPISIAPYVAVATTNTSPVTIDLSVRSARNTYIKISSRNTYNENAAVNSTLPSAVHLRLIDTVAQASVDFNETIFQLLNINTVGSNGELQIATPIVFSSTLQFISDSNIVSVRDPVTSSYGVIFNSTDSAYVSIVSNFGSIGRSVNDRLCFGDNSNYQLLISNEGCSFNPNGLLEHNLQLELSAIQGSIFINGIGLRVILPSTKKWEAKFELDVVITSVLPLVQLQSGSTIIANSVTLQTQTIVSVINSPACLTFGSCIGGISGSASAKIQANNINLFATGGSSQFTTFNGKSTLLPILEFSIGSSPLPIILVNYLDDQAPISLSLVGYSVYVTSSKPLLLQSIIRNNNQSIWSAVTNYLSAYNVSINSILASVTGTGIFQSSLGSQSNTIVANTVMLQSVSLTGTTISNYYNIGNYQLISGSLVPQRFISLRPSINFIDFATVVSSNSNISFSAKGNNIALESYSNLVLIVGEKSIYAEQRFDLRLFDGTNESSLITNESTLLDARLVSIEAQNGSIGSINNPLFISNLDKSLLLAVKAGNAYITSNSTVTLYPLLSAPASAFIIRKETSLLNLITLIVPGELQLTLTDSINTSYSVLNPNRIGIAAGSVSINVSGNLGSLAFPISIYAVASPGLLNLEQCYLNCDTVKLSLVGFQGFINTYATKTELFSNQISSTPIRFKDWFVIRGLNYDSLLLPATSNASGLTDIQAGRLTIQFPNGDIGDFTQLISGLPKALRVGLPDGTQRLGLTIENLTLELPDGSSSHSEGLRGRNISITSSSELYLESSAIYTSSKLVLKTYSESVQSVSVKRNPSAQIGSTVTIYSNAIALSITGNFGEREFVNGYEDTSRFIELRSATSDSFLLSGHANSLFVNAYSTIYLTQNESIIGTSISALAQTIVSSVLSYSGVVRLNFLENASMFNYQSNTIYSMKLAQLIITGTESIGSAESPIAFSIPGTDTLIKLKVSILSGSIAIQSGSPVEIFPFSLTQVHPSLSSSNFGLAIAKTESGNRNGLIYLETKGNGSNVDGFGDIIAGEFKNQNTGVAGTIIIKTEGAILLQGLLIANAIELFSARAIANINISETLSNLDIYASNYIPRDIGSSTLPISLLASYNSSAPISLRAAGANIYLYSNSPVFLPVARTNELATLRILPTAYNGGNSTLNKAYIHGIIQFRSSLIGNSVSISGPGSVLAGYLPLVTTSDGFTIPVYDPTTSTHIALHWATPNSNYDAQTGLIRVFGINTYIPSAGTISFSINGSILISGTLTASNISLHSISGTVGQSNTITIAGNQLAVSNIIANYEANPLLVTNANPFSFINNAVKVVRPGVSSSTLTQALYVHGSSVYLQSINSSLLINSVELDEQGVLEITAGSAATLASGFNYYVSGTGNYLAHVISILSSGSIGNVSRTDNNFSLTAKSVTKINSDGLSQVIHGSILLHSLFGNIGFSSNPLSLSSTSGSFNLSAWSRNYSRLSSGGSVYINANKSIALIIPKSVLIADQSVEYNFYLTDPVTGVVTSVPSLYADFAINVTTLFGYDIIGYFDSTASIRPWQSAFAQNTIQISAGGNLFSTGEFVSSNIALYSNLSIGKESVLAGRLVIDQNGLPNTTLPFSSAVKVSPIYLFGTSEKLFFQSLTVSSGTEIGNIYLSAKSDLYLNQIIQYNQNGTVELYAIGTYMYNNAGTQYVYGANILNRKPQDYSSFDPTASLAKRNYDYGVKFFEVKKFYAYASGDIGAQLVQSNSTNQTIYGVSNTYKFYEPLRVKTHLVSSSNKSLTLVSSNNIFIDLLPATSSNYLENFNQIFNFADIDSISLNSNPASHLLSIRQTIGALVIDKKILFNGGSVSLHVPFGSIVGSGSISTIGLLAGQPAKTGVLLEARDSVQLYNESAPLEAYFLIIKTEAPSIQGDLRVVFSPTVATANTTYHDTSLFENEISITNLSLCFVSITNCVFNNQTVLPRFVFSTDDKTTQVAFIKLLKPISVYYQLTNKKLTDRFYSYSSYQDPLLAVLATSSLLSVRNLGPVRLSPLQFQQIYNPFQDTELIPSEVVGLCKADIANRYDYISENYVTIGCIESE
ncbi:MAG: hypothetical protein QM538_06560, partial [Methylacidiphilales bacterium]|nr:hypothetical protein [Candidatus Methylacidiphilales bacterium]